MLSLNMWWDSHKNTKTENELSINTVMKWRSKKQTLNEYTMKTGRYFRLWGLTDIKWQHKCFFHIIFDKSNEFTRDLHWFMSDIQF